MIHQINGSDACHSVGSQMELELLAVLLEPEDATYPWNPADDESAVYFDELERQFAIHDVLDEELTTRSATFYGQLDTLWSEVETSSHYNHTTSSAVIDQLQESLPKAFVSRLPEGWLNAIANKATEIFTSSQSLAEQLAECVQTVLPTWATDDLSVLTRPYAYAMRSSEPQTLTSVINNVEHQEWANLSEIEQAKISVAIAYYVLRQLDDSQPEA
ncbi:hypothetical protein [Nostoc sp. TCL26-01]|uniref:hypothetical protein n=1 Tax=Nostoc sp. TCL26-01 TaxID=2576904 RepID=UPI0015C16116|nr:hypothetical protein [Nostoc sp. TCL26-01]QLE54367.1 hypothetical protein FD725_01740 [Nostoc sp. TCL26-01]